ncbi:Integrase regulator R [Pseudomonas batumici]|uniref:Integrase regulator R n=1 Tax=Pseudomonas batumici TaxID=226910 RepID=A0A0C2I601_9PSED|nr:Integrase regulator R [Pseudomonas batumici]
MDRSKMGVDLWAELIRDERTSINLVPDLYELELQRIVINMQISLTHSISRQAFLCACKVEVADQVYRQRMDQHISRDTEGN